MTTRDRDLYDAGLIGPRKDAYRPDPSRFVRWERAVQRDVVAPVLRVRDALGSRLRRYWRALTPFERIGDTASYVMVVFVLFWAAVWLVPQAAGLNDRVQTSVEARSR